MSIINTPNLNLPSNAGRGEAPGTWHTLWNQGWDSLEARLGLHGTASPGGAVAAALLGQFFLRQGAEPDLYFATATGDAATATWQGFYHSSITRRGGRGFAYQVVVSSAGGIAPSLALGNYFATTLTENTTIANPTGLVGGDLVVFDITQDAVTPRNLSWGTAYKGVVSGVVPFAAGIRFIFVFVVANNGDLVALRVPAVTPYNVLVSLPTDQVIPGGNTTLITGFGGIALPVGSVPGAQRTMASAKAVLLASSVNVITNLELRVGPLGTIADPVLAIDSVFQATNGGLISACIPSWLFTPAVGDKVTLSLTRGGGTYTILGTGSTLLGVGAGIKTWLSLVSVQ